MIRCAVIDDEKDVAKLLKYFIESYNIPLEITGVAFDGKEAIRLLQSDNFDLVFLDIQMPYYNGLEIMEKFPNNKYIIISAFELFEYVKKALQLGAIDYLTKPINRELFFKSVERAIGTQFTKDNIANLILEFIRTNYMYKIKLSDISLKLGYHPVYLSRKFKEVTGFSIMEYIVNFRMKAAKKLLLENPEITSSEIACMCGYSSMTSFYRDFKKVYHSTPNEIKLKG